MDLIAPMASSPPQTPPADDPLKLAELFQGGGEPWLPLLKPVIERLPNAAAFVGPSRDKRIVPVRELTFQALKPNPPEKWKVVIFGQTPYPRVESATGIARFDNTVHERKGSRVGVVTYTRCISKAACTWRRANARQTATAGLREAPGDD